MSLDTSVSEFEQQRLTRMISVAGACVQVCDHGEGQHLTLDECRDKTANPLTGLTSADLRVVVTVLAAQVVGLSHTVQRDASLAVAQIRTVLANYDAAVVRDQD